MMDAAERHRELVACLATQGPRLQVAQVTRYESLSIRAITGLPCEAYVPFARLRLVMKPFD